MSEHRHYLNLFRASTLRELAVWKEHPLLQKYAERLNATTPRDVFESGYKQLRKYYQPEYVLKNELLRWLRCNHEGAYIRTEYYIGGDTVRSGKYADVIAIGETSTAYEIKSRYDSPAKLKEQIDTYSRAFEYVVLITESRHTNKFYRVIPPYVGLSVLDRNGIRVVEAPSRYTEKLDPFTMLNGLYKAERIAFVKQVDPEAKHVESDYYRLSRTAAMGMGPAQMSSHFQDCLSRSNRPKRYLQFISDLPDCFTAALYDYYLPMGVLKTLIEVMDAPIKQTSSMRM